HDLPRLRAVGLDVGAVPGSAATISAGMPQLPSGAGSMTPPIFAWPSVNMSMNALRSSASASADRIFGSLKGAALRFTIKLVVLLVGCSSQIAFGRCDLMSLTSGTVRAGENGIGEAAGMNGRMRVERLAMTRHSMASRYGWPLRQ